jgi:hypothetical protein
MMKSSDGNLWTLHMPPQVTSSLSGTGSRKSLPDVEKQLCSIPAAASPRKKGGRLGAQEGLDALLS